jgi:glutamate dehydrogenase (NAD(P)+)
MAFAEKNGSLKGFSGVERECSQVEVLTAAVDICIPAATAHQINAEIAKNLKCRILAEGANNPVTPDGDRVLKEREKEIFLLPDILANAGGVTVSYFEWVQGLQNFFWSAAEVNQQLSKIMTKAFGEVVQFKKERSVYMRTATSMLAVNRVTTAMLARGLYP